MSGICHRCKTGGEFRPGCISLPVVDMEQKPFDGYWAEIILHSNCDGIFDSLWIDESVKGNVVEQDLWVEPGAEVKTFSAANRAVGMLILRFGDEKRLQEVMKDVSRFVKVKVRRP